jgi:hypothetical protein
LKIFYLADNDSSNNPLKKVGQEVGQNMGFKKSAIFQIQKFAKNIILQNLFLGQK